MSRSNAVRAERDDSDGRLAAAVASFQRTAGGAPQARLDRVLDAVRVHLGMEVAFVSEFTGGQRVFRHVASGPWQSPVTAGAGHPLEATYCQRVVDGRLPEVIPDTRLVPEAMSIPVTTALPVGSHISVPIYLRNGAVFGTFCCFSRLPDPTLRLRDATFMKLLASLMADSLEQERDEQRARLDAQTRIAGALQHGIRVVFQPIVDLVSGRTLGFEALARFPAEPPRTPDRWFAEASLVGRGVELELAAIRAAVASVDGLPPPAFLSLNASPDALSADGLSAALADVPPGRIVLELTEHAIIEDYHVVQSSITRLRSQGFRLAVDDAGAGYASLRHILKIRPEFVKLDISITRGVSDDPVHQAITDALNRFCVDVGAVLIAEGIESAQEVEALRRYGVQAGQGYYLARPAPLRKFLSALR